MTAHLHTSLVPGCYRCDLNRDEVCVYCGGEGYTVDADFDARRPCPVCWRDDG